MTEPPLVFRLFNEIGIIAQLAQNVFESVMPAGMTLAQFSVLNHFVRLGGRRSPADLARAFQVTRPTMTSTLQRLEAKGLVAVGPDPSDGRGKQVEITAAGRAMRETCIAAFEPAMIALAKLWPEPATMELIPRLTQLRMVLDANRGIGAATSSKERARQG